MNLIRYINACENYLCRSDITYSDILCARFNNLLIELRSCRQITRTETFCFCTQLC